MKRCWLHIGMHKTGTTSVQLSLSSVKRAEGWKYLKVGGSRNMGGALFAMFASKPHKYHWFIRRGDSPEAIKAEGERLRKKFAAAIAKCPAENIIVSGESLTLIDAAGIFRLRDFLKPLCDEVRVVGYVRSPIAFKISFFQQRIKHDNYPFDFSDFSPNYKTRFKKFDQAFGRENVILKQFHSENFPNGCVVEDFCQHAGLKTPPEFKVVRENERLCREACGLLYAYRRSGRSYGVGKEAIRENQYLIAPLIAMEGSKFTVSRKLVTPSKEEAKDRRWMERRLGESLVEGAVTASSPIASEEELLRIERSSCERFAEAFAQVHQMIVPPEKIPAGTIIEPQAAAEFLDFCRTLCGQKVAMRKAERKARNSRRPPPLRRLWRFVKKRALRLTPQRVKEDSIKN